MTAVTYTADQVQRLFDLLVGSMTEEQVRSVVSATRGWHDDCITDGIKQPELPMIADSLVHGYHNFYGDVLTFA